MGNSKGWYMVVLLVGLAVMSEGLTELGRRKKKEKVARQEEIEIVYCVTGHYVEGMGASIVSIIKGMDNQTERERLRFRIMVAQPPEEYFLETYLQALVLTHFHHSVATPLLKIKDFFLIRLFAPDPNHNTKLFQLRQSTGDVRLKSIMNAARFYIHEVFPELRKFIYLDSDVLLHHVNLSRIFDESLVGLPQPTNLLINFPEVETFYRNRAAGNTSKQDEVREFWGPEDFELVRKLKGPDYEPILLSGIFYINREGTEEGSFMPFDATFSYGNFFIVDMWEGGRIDPMVERIFDLREPAFYGGFWITDMRQWISRNITGRVEEWLIHHNKFDRGIFKGLTNAPLIAVFYKRWENFALREKNLKFVSMLGYGEHTLAMHNWTTEGILNSSGVFEWQGPAKPWMERGRNKDLFALYAPGISWRSHIMFKIKSKWGRQTDPSAIIYQYDSDDVFSLNVLDSLTVPPPSLLV
eukprot:CAMPEP_0174254500 /NCGR_PEP_ID=MMETSP0439-20130205/3815_1 /TAXON_ID=0 /ORGANISM="Stereomyxa ramosa, Strain Chinc5" /LENGTH=468 /DNA_ID=CAMNT_0015336113 /DNA_START=61 /DNA_END=1467 /DNA_ORIENTATION=-